MCIIGSWFIFMLFGLLAYSLITFESLSLIKLVDEIVILRWESLDLLEWSGYTNIVPSYKIWILVIINVDACTDIVSK